MYVPEKCSICNEQYHHPKLLPCIHRFCQDCIVSLRIPDRDFHCPECCKDVNIPDDDVKMLPDAPPVHHSMCLKLGSGGTEDDLQCDVCSRRVCAQDQHARYCCDCSELICQSCTIQVKHKEHDCKCLSEVVKETKKEIDGKLPSVRLVHKRVKGAAVQISDIKDRIEEQEKSLTHSLESSLKRFRQTLDRYETNMRRKISQTTKSKVRKLDEQRLEFERISAEMQRLEELVTSCLQIEAPINRELLQLYVFLQKRISQILQQYSRVNIKPVEMPNLAIKMPCGSHLQEIFQKHAGIITTQADSSKCTAEGPGLVSAETMKFEKLTVTALDKGGEPCKFPQNVSVEVKCLSNDDKFHADVTATGMAEYQVSFCPKYRGEHEITIRVNDKMIPRSPFNIVVLQPVTQLGQCHTIIEGLTNPRGLALKPNGNLLVCEWNRGRVVELDDLGRQVGSFGSGQLIYPASVAINWQGTFYVVDAAGGRSCVNKFSNRGDLMSSVGREGTNRGEFKKPRGIAVNSRTEVFVCDRDNHRIQVFSSGLVYVRIINLRNIDEGLLKPSMPNDIAFDPSGNMYITDYANNCILAFNTMEKYLFSFSSEGTRQGCLAGPENIHIDKDMIYVTESHNHRVSIFRSSAPHEFIASFGRIGKSVNELNFPMGIVTNRSGMVYVCELLNNRIQVF